MATPARVHKARVYKTPAEVASRLHELDVTQETLRRAVEYGLSYASDVTRHDPNGAEGSMMWIKSVRGLNQALFPYGWKADRTKNYETTVHPTGSHAIAVAAGNAHTGIEDKEPSTKRDRGPATVNVVATNYTLNMFDVLDEEGAPRPIRLNDTARRLTWLLLHYHDKQAEEVRLELSLPLTMTSDGYVKEWQERVILTAIPSSRDPLPMDHSDEEGVDVPVIRKAN